MTMRKLLAVSFLSFAFSISVYSQSWMWGKQGNGASEPSTPASDTLGNVYLTGYFYGQDSMSFGPYKFVNHISNTNMGYIVGYDKNGNIRWAQAFNKTNKQSTNQPNMISTDLSGNVLVAGTFEDTLIVATDTLISTYPYGLPQPFIAKFNSNGSLLWMKTAGAGSNEGEGLAITADKRGNSYLLGWFYPQIYFGSIFLNTNWGGNFIVKYSPTGVVKWATDYTFSNRAQAYPTGATTDLMGNLYITGDFFDTLRIGSYTFIDDRGGWNTFIAKYDSSGNLLWANQSHPLGQVSSIVPSSIAVDTFGYSYITGTFIDTISFGSQILYGPANLNYSNMFFVKYSPAGNAVWARDAKLYSASASCMGGTVAADLSNHIYLAAVLVSGGFYDTIIIANDTIPLVYNDAPGFIAQMDTSGKILCGERTTTVGGGFDDINMGASLNGKYIYLGSDFGGTQVFGPDTLKATAGESPFVARWFYCGDTNITTSIKVLPQNNSVSVYPIPSTGKLTLQLEGAQNFASAIEIYNMVGEKVYAQSTNHHSEFILDLGTLSNGIYFLKMQMQDGSTNIKKIEIAK